MINDVLLAGKSVVIASYTHTVNGEYTNLGGPALALRDYLKGRVRRLLCIWQPVPSSDTLSAIAQFYEDGKISRTYKLPVINWPFGRQKAVSFLYLALKIRDILSVFYFIFKFRIKFDLFIGIEALNVFLGRFIRGFGFAKKIIYYNFDYAENRFGYSLLNFAFHNLDKSAVYHADYTWSLSEQIISARKKRFNLDDDGPVQLVVPIGINFYKINRLTVENIERKTIVYLGLLNRPQGVQLAIEAFTQVLKLLPDAKLVIMGSGDLAESLKGLTGSLGLEGQVTFTGLVSEEEAYKTLTKSAIAVAPYLDDPESPKRFTDTTKPKVYLACGLPVVITRVPPIAELIAKKRMGIAINYNKEEMAQALIRLLTDDQLYKEYRKNAIDFSSGYDWENIFNNAFTLSGMPH